MTVRKRKEQKPFNMTPGDAKQIAKSHEDYIEKKKSKNEMLRAAQDKIAALSPAAINQAMKIELERLKRERLIGSHTYDEVAKEFNIYLRTLKEYVSGKRTPGKGIANTRYGLLLEKYYLNTDVNLWYIRDDWKAEQEANQLKAMLKGNGVSNLENDIEVEIPEFSPSR